MPVIKVRENEPFDVALRRFKRSCEKAGVLAEVRRREFYENRLQNVSALKRLLLSVTPRNWLAKRTPHSSVLISFGSLALPSRVKRRQSQVRGRAFRKEARLIFVYERRKRGLWPDEFHAYLSVTYLPARTLWILLMPALS